MDTLLRDLRFAAQSLARRRGFAAVVALTLALGIGATVTMYSVVHAVLLAALPFPDPDRLVEPQSGRRGAGPDERWAVTFRDYLAWREQRVFPHVAAFATRERDLVGAGAAAADAPLRTVAATVTDGFFPTLGVQPARGRLPRPDEFTPGAASADLPLVISHGLWQRRFGGSPAALGAAVRLGGLPATVVGVLPAGAEWPRDAEVWSPNRAAPDASTLAPDNYVFGAVARVGPAGTPEAALAAARARLETIARATEAEFPAKRAGVTVTAAPLREALVGATLTRALWILLAAVGFVLAIACVNVANLLLVQAERRRREIALRTALGAARQRLVRQLLTESVVLAVPGGLLGVLLALAGIAAARAFAPSDLPRLGDVRLDLPVLAAAGLATVGAAVAFGLLPALSASRRPGGVLGTGGTRTTGGVSARRTSGALVVVEIALSLMLLAGAGLLGRSLSNLWRADTGLDPTRVLTFEVALPRRPYDQPGKQLAFWAALQQRLATLPGVEAASVASALPLRGGGLYLGRTVIAAGAPEPPQGSEVAVHWNAVAPAFFRTVGQPLREGRDFTARDDSASPQVVVVNQAFVRAMFPDGRALGRRVTSWRDERKAREIVGVVGDVRYEGAADTTRPLVYVPLAQDPWRTTAVVVRAAGPPAGLTAAVRRELAALDPNVAMARVRTLEQARAATIAGPRFSALLLGAFAALALGLAAVGLYGVVSFGVAQRVREIGIRQALGATAADVLRLVLGGALRLGAAGVVLGVAGAFAMTRLLRALLFGVGPGDPLTLAGVTAVLLVVALAAGLIPARRATRVAPSVALRAE